MSIQNDFFLFQSELDSKTKAIDDLTKSLNEINLEVENLTKKNESKASEIQNLNGELRKRILAIERSEHLVKENSKIQTENKKLCEELDSWKKRNSDLQKAVHNLKVQLKKKKNRKPTPMTNEKKKALISEVLKPFFSEVQISAFLRGSWKQIKKWSHDDYVFALTIRLISRKTYQYLRDRKCLPLPGLSTLKQYFRDFHINEGTIDSVVTLLKIQAAVLKPVERVVSLAFDEVHIRSDISWNPKEDKVVGPHKDANTMMLRLIFTKMKIPIWFRFDKALGKDELFEIIEKVESAGYHVKSIVCDMGPKNRGLAKALGIKLDFENPENSITWFENPSRKGSKIFFLYDVPHLLKLARNNIQRYGVQLQSGAEISEEAVKNIQSDIDQSDINTDSKLKNPRIYNVKDLDKQKVVWAAQFLSSSMADAIRKIYPENPDMLEFADLIQVIDDGFDTLNSRGVPKGKSVKELNSAYGKCLQKQEDALKTLRETVLNIKILNKHNKKYIKKGTDKINRQP